ncbi:hypothetical protein T05_3578 [Trichinella murrelli]|uniref:Uncharacterized protein n=1 Tax=Trichinella murrelli TaxID=144512 RepID=A0A0V0UCM8_9BILA|nr:hypothetical protein T05_3578 [Trichinella murrelli]
MKRGLLEEANAEISGILGKIDCPVTIRGALSGTVPRVCQTRCAEALFELLLLEVLSGRMFREETMSKARMCKRTGNGGTGPGGVGIESSRLSGLLKEKRYFPDRPCPIIKISENSMAVSSLLVTGSWQILISRDFCDALGLKGPPVVTAAQRKSVGM